MTATAISMPLMSFDVLRAPYSPPLGQRIAIIGLSGAGKTTLAHHLSQQLAVPHIELDALYWQENWTPTPLEYFRQEIAKAIKYKVWVIEGSYHDVYDLIWQEADTLVWLDLPLPLLMTRLLKRTIGNLLTGATLWKNNHEQASRLLSRQNIFLKLLNSYHTKRQVYIEQLNQPQYRHLDLIHLRSPRAVQQLVDSALRVCPSFGWTSRQYNLFSTFSTSLFNKEKMKCTEISPKNGMVFC